MENKLMGLFLDGFPDLTSQDRKKRRRDTEIQDTPDSEQSENQGYDPVNTNHCNKHYLVLYVKLTTSQANMIIISLDFVWFFIAWLYLIGGLSQKKCQEAIKFISYIIENCRKHPQTIWIEKKIPEDICKIMKHLKLDAKIQYHIFCQACYSLYDIDFAPSECKYQATPDSLICGADLFEPRDLLVLEHLDTILKDQWGIKPKRPISVFASQSFSEWLEWFLILPEVELFNEYWPQILVPNSTDVVDYCHLASWSSLRSDMGKTGNSLLLLFSLFVYLFNPLGNKIAGKQSSLGIFALTCLNLSPSVQYKPQYTFMAGMIPAPNQPNMITINNILKPLVKEMLELNRPTKFQTLQFPLGRTIVICLGALIGDLVATHKVSGFASHSETKLCSWCNMKKADITNMKIDLPQNKNNTLALAHRWHDEKKNTEREKLVKKQKVV
ncbi:hypothetical protein O181_030065 [Austropuccinia psidii MF-1]|uniref:Uncharacterized protein n=1 Tax=Austropuccinia psidii MF-1 TaxID=1389203 RepID=A0A9Q3CVK2_9BASI|nr:hypothetical protein [Austropuccinia psidii MF-1]